ncbi:hypothetical protein AY518_04580 [Corynebacterium diphtheriae bv. gravis]|nr:hypothetical protein AY518_04580 [Corynebacterium diphtheriae bv. gravis]
MALPVLECIDFVSDVGWPWLALVGVGWRWWARHPRSPPEKTALHTKSSQTASFLAIWCEVLCKMPRNTPV